jgi:hypothetical protein
MAAQQIPIPLLVAYLGMLLIIFAKYNVPLPIMVIKQGIELVFFYALGLILVKIAHKII